MTKEIIEIYKKMYFIRSAQEHLSEYYFRNKILSMVHFSTGEEAVAVGVIDQLEDMDKVLGNHRSHGHYLAKGGSLYSLVSELLGRSTGCSGGYGGSMHLIDKEVGFEGTSPILGSAVPIACGVAYKEKKYNSGGIVVVFYGDGASEEGIVYESYNLAALYRLPVLFVLENNYNSINSRLENRRSSDYSISKIATGMGVKYFGVVDGNDFFDVQRNASNAINYVRSHTLPALLDVSVFRHMAHSAPLLEEKYRDIDHREAREKHDCVKNLKIFLEDEGMSVQELEKKIDDEVVRVISLAESAPWPDTTKMLGKVYAA